MLNVLIHIWLPVENYSVFNFTLCMYLMACGLDDSLDLLMIAMITETKQRDTKKLISVSAWNATTNWQLQ